MRVCMYCICVYVYMYMYVCIIYGGNCPRGNVLPKTGGGIVRGKVSGGSVLENCPGAKLSYTRPSQNGIYAKAFVAYA